MAIREGAWDCPHCGRKRNRGPEKFCGGCGAPRGEDVKFYLPDDAREVVEADELRRAQAGPDWNCSFCEADNRADQAFCSSCGAAHDADALARPVAVQPLVPPPPPVAAPAGLVSAVPAAGETPPAGKSRWKRGCQIGCLGLLALGFLVWLLGRPTEATLTVSGFRWERTIAVEELRTVTEQGWEGELPAGARSLSTSREIHHHNQVQIGTETRTRTVSERVQTGTERVKVGQRDLGNGYFEDVYEDQPVYEDRDRQETYREPIYRQDPVYRIRHRYEIDKWVASREAKAGAADHTAVWPDPDLGEKEREGERKEAYEVLFVDKDGAGSVYKARDEVDWRGFEEGAKVRAKVRGGEVVEVMGPS